MAKTTKAKKKASKKKKSSQHIGLLIVGVVTLIVATIGLAGIRVDANLKAQKLVEAKRSVALKQEIDSKRLSNQAKLDEYIDKFGVGGQEFTRGKVDACAEVVIGEFGFNTQHSCYYRQVLYLVYDENVGEVAENLSQHLSMATRKPTAIDKLPTDKCYYHQSSDYLQDREFQVDIRLSLYTIGEYSDCPVPGYDLDGHMIRGKPIYYLRDIVDFDSLKGTITATSKKSVLVISFTNMTGVY